MRISRLMVVAALTVSVGMLTACGSDSGPKSDGKVAGPTAASSAAPAPPASPSTAPVDPKALLQAIAAKGVPLTNIAVQDENTDPNNLLGRPNGYTGRGSADLAGGDKDADAGDIDRGVVVEVWPDQAAADARSKYIQDALKAGGAVLGTEYHYRAAGGRVLVRVTGKVKPSVASSVETAVQGL